MSPKSPRDLGIARRNLIRDGTLNRENLKFPDLGSRRHARDAVDG